VSVAIHNTDDHLRNTGLLRKPDGWHLSPVFDINPNPDLRERRQTSICGAESAEEEPDGLMLLAEACRLDLTAARRIIDDVLAAARSWRRIAKSNLSSSGSIERFADSLDTQHARLRSLVDASHRVGGVSEVGPATIDRAAKQPGRRPPGRGGGQFAPKAHVEPSVNPKP